MRDQKVYHIGFFPCNFYNSRNKTQKILTFSVNPFATWCQVQGHIYSQIIEIESKPPLKKVVFLVESL